MSQTLVNPTGDLGNLDNLVRESSSQFKWGSRDSHFAKKFALLSIFNSICNDVKEKNISVKTLLSPQPTQHTVLPSSHVPICSSLRLCSLHHQLILYLDDEVAYLSVAFLTPSPRVSVGSWKAVWRASAKPPKSLALHPLMRESTWQRESKLICVWNANVNSLGSTLWMRTHRALLLCCKTHLLCVF